LLPVLIPVGLVTGFGRRAAPALDATHRFVGQHARQIGIAIEPVFALCLIGRGIDELP
jgi:hypothetical protein